MPETSRSPADDFSLLMKNVTDHAIFKLDKEVRILTWNAGAVRNFGYSAEEILGRNASLLFIPEDIEQKAPESELHTAETSRHAPDERWHMRKNGSRFWGSGTVYPLIDDQGESHGFVKVVRDFTERKQTLEALMESEKKTEFLLEHVKDHALFMIGKDGRIASWNKGAERLLGYEEGEAVNQPLDLIFTPEDAEAGAPRQELEQARLKGKAEDERWHKRKDGSYFWASGSVVPLKDQDGNIRAFIKLVRDATERKRAEDSQKMESIGRLAGGIAHDFNNMLTAVNGYCELMEASLPTEGASREWLEEIHKAGNRAAALTRQLLAFSSRQVLAPIPLQLNDAIRNMEVLLQKTLREDIRLKLSLHPGLETILMDPAQIEQAILNLALNSREAMPHGGTIFIQTSRTVLDTPLETEHFSLAPGPYALLRFRDTGKGMDSRTKARIFEPFFSTKKKGTGSMGMGLSTVYGIVRQSGGGITVESEPGRGAEFRLYLPFTHEIHAAGRRSPEPRSVIPQEETRRILLVEDEAAVRKLTAQALEINGYVVLKAHDGVEALSILKIHPEEIHLVLTDVMMPNMGGLELDRHIKALRPQLPVAFMSGYTEDVVTTQAGHERNVFIQKPFTINTLLDKVREALDVAQYASPA
jgi:PAS domain S-box-containing protein